MEINDLQKRIADNIKRLRKGKFTQETLSEAANISLPTLNGIECCNRGISEEVLVKLANALNCDVYEFFIPSESENVNMKDSYSAIRHEVLSQIKSKLNETIEKLEN